MNQDLALLRSSLDSSATVQGKREVSEKRRNGVFYTPERATQILTRWAIQNPTEKILEPSFGGCGFLVSSRNRLVELGNLFPERYLYGCDIDSKAFEFLRVIFNQPDEQTHFKKTDFLTIESNDFPRVSAVIGNPPYVSLHNMSKEQRIIARAVANANGIAINGRASLWTYFVLHSLAFLESGGRMAWILPGSFIYSEYAKPLRQKLSTSFSRCLAVLLEDRIFVEEGTEESSVVLLCEGYQTESIGAIRFDSVKGLNDLENIVQQWTEGINVGDDWTERPQLALVPQSSHDCYARLIRQPYCHRLAEFADIKIGIVTGDNRYFVLSEAQVQQASLPNSVVEPILARFAHCKGLDLTPQDMEEMRRAGLRCLLFSTIRESNLSEEVLKYLDTFPANKKERNVTFKSRDIWHQPKDPVRPDAFFSSMQSEGPILMLNSAGVSCTNTVYRVQFFQDLFATPDPKMLAVTLQSTFSQFSAEVEGRSFGHGALKVEPSEAKKIALLLTESKEDLDETFSEMDSWFRIGNRTEARNTADRWLLRHNLLSVQDITQLQAGLDKLRTMRSGYRKETIE